MPWSTSQSAQPTRTLRAVAPRAERLACMLVAAVLAGCGGDGQGAAENTDNAANQPTGEKMTTTLTVAKIKDGQEWQIGTITFDDGQAGTLSINADGAAGAQLTQDWEELSQRDTLPLEYRDEREVDGEVIVEHLADPIPKGDDRYPDAVWSYLESNYGYLVEKSR